MLETSSMRHFSCTRQAGTSDRRRWLQFTMLSSLLVWLAAGGIGLVRAQEPADKAPAPAVPKDEGAPPAGGDAAPGPAAGSTAAAPSSGAGTTPPRREN